MSEDNGNLIRGIAFIAAILAVPVGVSQCEDKAAPPPPKLSAEHQKVLDDLQRGLKESQRMLAEYDQPVITRAEFLTRCGVGTDYVDCTKAVGRPSRTQESTSGIDYYYFAARTRDPVTGKIDRQVQVVFQNGRARAINFY